MSNPSYEDSAAEAAAELQRLLKETPGDKIVLGHSMYEGDVRDVIAGMVFADDEDSP